MLNQTFGNFWKNYFWTFGLLATFGKDLEDLGSFWEVTFGLKTTVGRDFGRFGKFPNPSQKLT